MTTPFHKQITLANRLYVGVSFLEKFADVQEVIIDVTERPVKRPQDAEQQKEHYSGKKTTYAETYYR